MDISNVARDWESMQLMQRYGVKPIIDEEITGPRVWAGPYKVKQTKFVTEEVNNVLATLPDREQEVLRMRFGLSDGCQHTLKEVERALGVTKETIRKSEAKVLCLLGYLRPARSRRLKDYLDI